MSYRNYIGFIPKRMYNKLKNLTVKEVSDFYGEEMEYFNGKPYRSVSEFGEELYCLGDYVDFNSPKKSITNFFKKKETQEYFEEDLELKVVTKEFLAYIIENYKNRIKTYYNEMVLPFLNDDDFLNSVNIKYTDSLKDNYQFDFSKITDKQQTALFNMIQHIRSMKTEWVSLTPFNLDRGNQITESWKYEYAIFELIRIYKSFNWKKNIMIYYGY